MRDSSDSSVVDKKYGPELGVVLSSGRAVMSLLFVVLVLSGIRVAHAGEIRREMPDSAASGYTSCRELNELAKKYGANGTLSQSVFVEGKACPKDEMARCLLSVMDRMLDKCDKEGPEAVPGEERERVSRLHEELKDTLSSMGEYQTRRETIEKFLSPPEEPSFLFKAGLKGFIRGEGAGNQRLSELAYNPGHAEGRFLYRVLPYAYWHPTEYLDIHLEGQGYGYTGGGQYLGKISLYQGFVEGRLPGTDLLTLKVGRQELVYGSTFILGSDAFFKGLTFDAALLRVKPLEALTVDLLGGWYATPWSDGIKGNLVGGYASYTLGEGAVLEAYGFNDTGSDEHHAGEYTNIWGLRGSARLGPVSIEIEPVYECGRAFNSLTGSNDRLTAWGGHADITVEAELFGKKNTFFASYAYGSGGKDAANGVSARREFRHPATDTALTGDMSLIGDLSGVDAGDYRASGMQVFNLGWGIDLTEKLNFTAAGRYFYANAVPAGFSRRLGLETDFTFSYAVSDKLSLLVGYDRFFTGKFFRDATGSGKDVDYGYVQAQFDLSWVRQKGGKKP